MTTPIYTPPPLVCCCRHGGTEHNGYIVFNAGCRIHGLKAPIYMHPRSPISKEMQIPDGPVKYTGSFHRIADGE